jgi:hypothetical protein
MIPVAIEDNDKQSIESYFHDQPQFLPHDDLPDLVVHDENRLGMLVRLVHDDHQCLDGGLNHVSHDWV